MYRKSETSGHARQTLLEGIDSVAVARTGDRSLLRIEPLVVAVRGFRSSVIADIDDGLPSFVGVS